MTDNIKALDYNGVKVKLDTNTKLKILQGATSGSDNLTLHDLTNNSNYQVPVGKKATIIFFEQIHPQSVNASIIYADNVDGNLNAVTLLAPNTTSNLGSFIFISAEVPAGKYINQRNASGSGVWTKAPKCAIIEEDA